MNEAIEPDLRAVERRKTLRILAVTTLMVAIIFVATRRVWTVPLNTPYSSNETAYAVIEVKRLPAIGSLGAKRGSFLIVRLGVRNTGSRTNVTLNPALLAVDDATGGVTRLDEAATRAIQAPPFGQPACTDPIAPGGSCTTDVVFDLPASSAPTFLRITRAGADGWLDWLVNNRARFVLEPAK